MRRFLLALPLFLVVGLAFVELPSGNSVPGTQTVSTSDPMNIAKQPTSTTNTKIDIAPKTQDPFKKFKSESDDDDDDRYENEESDDDEGFEEEDD
jgi:hypothetical protein